MAGEGAYAIALPASRRGSGAEHAADDVNSGPAMTDQARTPPATARACPICGKPVEQAFRPFCSPRCRDVDLNRWLSGSYAIPGRNEADEDEE